MTSSALVRAGQFNQAARQGAYIFIALALPRLGVPTELIGAWETLVFLGYLLAFGWVTGLLQGFLIRMGELVGVAGEVFARRATLATLGFSAVVLAVAALSHPLLFQLLHLQQAPIGWYYFFVLLLSRWPSYCLEQALLLTGRAKWLLAYAVGNSVGLIGALLLPLYLGHGLLTAMQVLAAFAGAKALGILLWTLAAPRPPAGNGSPVLAGWVRQSAPLMAYATVASLVAVVDPLFVSYWYAGDPEVFAIFRYGVRELPLVAALTSGMVTVAIPVIARERTAGLALLREQSGKLFHYVFALTFLLLLTADWWWTRVFTEAFAASLPIFRTFLLVVGCRLVFAMTVLTALNETKRLYLWGLLELALNLVLSLLLVRSYGLLGIIWATVIASYFHEICLVLYLRYRTRTSWKEYANLRWYGVYLVGLFLGYWWVG